MRINPGVSFRVKLATTFSFPSRRCQRHCRPTTAFCWSHSYSGGNYVRSPSHIPLMELKRVKRYVKSDDSYRWCRFIAHSSDWACMQPSLAIRKANSVWERLRHLHTSNRHVWRPADWYSKRRNWIFIFTSFTLKGYYNRTFCVFLFPSAVHLAIRESGVNTNAG